MSLTRIRSCPCPQPGPSSPGPRPRPYSTAADEVAWYATLPTMFGAAAALFTNPAGRVLLVKPNYRDHWSLPGGILEHGEPPHEGCRREVEEELGLQITPGPLLIVDWAPPDGVRPRPIVHFVFDGGELDDECPIQLQEDELDDYRFVAPGRARRVPAAGHRARVTAALRSRVTRGRQPTCRRPSREPGSPALTY